MNDRLYRSRDERMFAGVAGGIAERYDVDPSLVRIVWVVLMLLTGGLFFLIYIVMALVVPEAPGRAEGWPDWTAAPPAAGAVPGWEQPGTGGTTAAFAAGAATGATGGTPLGPDEAADAMAPTGPDTAATDEPTSTATGAAPAMLAGAYSPPPAGQPPTPAGPPPWAVPPPRRRQRARDGSGVIIGGIVLVLIGGYFLLRQFAPQLQLGSAWPAILVIVGFALVIGSIRPGRRNDDGG